MKRKLDLLIHPSRQENGIYQSINPSSANWKFLSFEARKMKINQSWDFETNGNEIAIVLLSGNFKVTSIEEIGRRLMVGRMFFRV